MFLHIIFDVLVASNDFTNAVDQGLAGWIRPVKAFSVAAGGILNILKPINIFFACSRRH